ncbi:uncharacterized protein METZ01_LOCUS441365, partial [marine metagenome]
MSQTFEENLQDAEKLLTRFREETLVHFINGRHEAGCSGDTFET